MYPHRIWKFAAACVLAAVLPSTGAPVAASAPRDCPALSVVAIPGTWETSADDPREGVLALSLNDLPGDVRVDYVGYAATAFPWEGEVYGRSKQEAVTKARALVADAARSCPVTRIALLGYSQGADAAGDVAAEIGSGTGVVPADRVALVGLVADPRRSPADTLIGPPVLGAGAGGPRPGGFGWLTPRTYTFCAAGDLYCAMPDGDFAGRIAGFVVELSNPDPGKIDRYHREGADLLGDAISAGGLGLLSDQLGGAAYEERARQLDDFLKSGVHQSYPEYVVGPGAMTPFTWLRRKLLEGAEE